MENGSRDSTKQSMVETATLVALVTHALYLVILAQCIDDREGHYIMCHLQNGVLHKRHLYQL